MIGELALRWQTNDPTRAETRLADVGFTTVGTGLLGCRGLRIRVERGPGERLAGIEPRDQPEDLPGHGPGALVDRPRLLAVGIATVDLERAADALGGLVERLPDDELLGARSARGRDPRLILLEPSREGRLAATLARTGEGPAALYLGLGTTPLAVAMARLRAGGAHLDAGSGPLGPQLLVRADPRWAPHLALVAVPDGW